MDALSGTHTQSNTADTHNLTPEELARIAQLSLPYVTPYQPYTTSYQPYATPYHQTGTPLGANHTQARRVVATRSMASSHHSFRTMPVRPPPQLSVEDKKIWRNARAVLDDPMLGHPQDPKRLQFRNKKSYGDRASRARRVLRTLHECARGTMVRAEWKIVKSGTNIKRA